MTPSEPSLDFEALASALSNGAENSAVPLVGVLGVAGLLLATLALLRGGVSASMALPSSASAKALTGTLRPQAPEPHGSSSTNSISTTTMVAAKGSAGASESMALAAAEDPISAARTMALPSVDQLRKPNQDELVARMRVAGLRGEMLRSCQECQAQTSNQHTQPNKQTCVCSHPREVARC